MRRLNLEIMTDVTVLIGANGSGKSNVIGALELISRIWDDSFQQQILNHGGMDGLIFEGADGKAARTRIEVHSTPDRENHTNGYRVDLSPADDDRAMLREWFFHDDRQMGVRFHDEGFGQVAATSSRARQVAEGSEDERQRNFARHITPLLAGCRVFHFDDFVLEPNATDRIRLRWRQQGLDRTFMAREASDGTLRFICLATLLLGPDLPSTVVLDEPELGLHLAAIAVLADMVHTAGRAGHRIILATQSVPLLSHFGLDEVVVLDRREGATVATRPDPEELAGFLEDFSVGNMWEMNLLGGRPQSSEVIR